MQKTNQQNNKINKTDTLASIKTLINKLKHAIDNELRLKKVIQRAQKIDHINNSLLEDKLDMKNSLYVNLFLLFNSLTVGFWMFSNK